MNTGEEICGSWLQYIKGCICIYGQSVPGGSIDVIGINLKKHTVWACEVAIHTRGLHYNKNGKQNNVLKIVEKLKRNIDYIKKEYAGWNHKFMFWTPVVTPKGKRDIEEIQNIIKRDIGEDIEFIISQKFEEAMESLRNVAREETRALPEGSYLRYCQIEECLKKHLKKQK